MVDDIHLEAKRAGAPSYKNVSGNLSLDIKKAKGTAIKLLYDKLLELTNDKDHPFVPSNNDIFVLMVMLSHNSWVDTSRAFGLPEVERKMTK